MFIEYGMLLNGICRRISNRDLVSMDQKVALIAFFFYGEM